jgi:ribosomal protein L1
LENLKDNPESNEISNAYDKLLEQLYKQKDDVCSAQRQKNESCQKQLEKLDSDNQRHMQRISQLMTFPGHAGQDRLVLVF